MSYRQLRAPNLRVTGVSTMCLAYVRSVFGAPGGVDYALLAWQNAKQKHTGRDMPDVAVPVWFNYTATIDGIHRNWGHVVVWVPGKGFYSTTKQGIKVFDSIDAIIKYIGGSSSYLGWSEDINGVDVADALVDIPPAHSPFDLPGIGERILLVPNQNEPMSRTTYKAGTAEVAGTIKVPAKDLSYEYTVRGIDSKFPNRIIINSASAGGNGVSLALYYLGGGRIDNWKEI